MPSEVSQHLGMLGGLQQPQEDKESFINLPETALIINRTNILAYASKHQDHELLVKPKHKYKQTANILRIRVTTVWLQR